MSQSMDTMAIKSPHPLLRAALGFAGGIAAHRLFATTIEGATAIAMALLVATSFLVYVILRRRNRQLSAIAGPVVTSAFAMAGMLAAYYAQKTKMREKAAAPLHSEFYVAKITGNHVRAGSNGRYLIKTLAKFKDNTWQPAGGKGLMYVRHDTAASLGAGNRLLIAGAAGTIPHQINPADFDYREYLHNKGIYYRDFVTTDQIAVLSIGTGDPETFFLRLNERLRGRVQRFVTDPSNMAIANAMLLGNKNDIPDDLRHAYSAAGASHILAVSGLHVGIVFLVLHSLMNPFRRRPGGTPLYLAVLLTGIWMFAGITAFSASVTRASIMISVVLFANILRSGSRILNSLSAAALLMLLYDPDTLFDVGFQLSYGAVAGIALFYRDIRDLMHPPGVVLGYFWKLIALSISVQIAVAPLVALYFHQFPLMFAITGAAVVPAAAAILVCLLLMLPASYLMGDIASIIALPDMLIGALNRFILAVGSLSYSHLEQILITPSQTILLTGFLVCTALFILNRKRMMLRAAVAAGLLLLVLSTALALRTIHRDYLIVYATPGQALIDIARGPWWCGYPQKAIEPKLKRFVLQPARMHYNMKRAFRQKLADDQVVSAPNWTLLIGAGKKTLVLGNRYDGATVGPWPDADLIVLTGTVQSAVLRQLVASNPEYLLFYSTALSMKQQSYLQSHCPARCIDLSQGAFKLDM